MTENTEYERYVQDTKSFMEHFRLYLTNQFGERCPDFDEDCSCCKIWAIYDETNAIVTPDVETE